MATESAAQGSTGTAEGMHTHTVPDQSWPDRFAPPARRTNVKRMWLPTHGRLTRRIQKQSDNGWTFTGCVASGILGLVLCHLAYEQR